MFVLFARVETVNASFAALCPLMAPASGVELGEEGQGAAERAALFRLLCVFVPLVCVALHAHQAAVLALKCISGLLPAAVTSQTAVSPPSAPAQSNTMLAVDTGAMPASLLAKSLSSQLPSLMSGVATPPINVDPSPSPCTAPLLELFQTINSAMEEEIARGFTINAHQPPESAARLDAAVRAAVAAYVEQGHSDWRQLAAFNEQHYVRHLVDECDSFEMILICWGKGQQSRVHNHANSHCWLNVLSGGVEELRYSSGTSPVELQPAVAPRLPGVIAATT